MAKIQVKAQQRRFPVAPNLYGLFFEDINRSADSGLYPEMLRNRSFEDSIVPDGCKLSEDKMTFTSPTGWVCEFAHGEGKQAWIDADQIPPTDIPAWYADGAEMTLERANTLNLKRRAALNVKFADGGCIRNTGYVGVSVEAGKAYEFYMFAASVGDPASLTVSVESKDGTVYAAKSFRVAHGYAKYACTFVSAGTDCDAVFVIRAEKACEMLFGFTSLMPADTYNGHGMRIDLMEKLAGMKPKFLRFPGGCIVEGFSEESVMRFSKTVGPVWERPTHWNLWNYRTTNGLGFHEYLQICEDLDLEPLYVFNCGMTCQARIAAFLSDDLVRDLLEEAKNALEYARGSIRTKWGALRAKMGHPEPFRMTYLEIGNENGGPEYNKRYEQCYRELKALYPDIKFVSNTHTERDGLPTEIADEHFYSTPEFFAENMHRYDSYPRSGPEIFVGEFAVTNTYTAQLRAAAAEAMFMIGMEHNQDVVRLESYAPLFENVHYKSWNPNLLVFNNHQSYCIPSYYSWKLFGSHRGQYVVESDYDSERVYRRYSGVPFLFADAGTKFRAAMLNGKPVNFIDGILGSAKAEGDGFVMLPGTEEQAPKGRMAQDPKRVEEFMSRTFLTADAPASDAASFSVEVLVEEGKSLRFGISASRKDGSAEDSHTLTLFRGMTWFVENGKTFVRDGVLWHGDWYLGTTDAAVKVGEYNTFAYEADPTGGRLYINGALVGTYTIPNYQKTVAVALEDGEDVIVKLVNFSEKAEPVEIALDCGVQSEYEIHRVSGNAEDANSFENPENVHDVTLTGTGASQQFTYEAPAYSVNVLVLKRS